MKFVCSEVIPSEGALIVDLSLRTMRLFTYCGIQRPSNFGQYISQIVQTLFCCYIGQTHSIDALVKNARMHGFRASSSVS